MSGRGPPIIVSSGAYMDFNEFKILVQELSKDCSDYANRRESLFQQSWNRKLDASSIRAAGNAANEPLKAQYEGLHERLDGICVAYLTMKEREQAREFVDAYPELIERLPGHLGWSTRRVQSGSDQQYLMR